MDANPKAARARADGKPRLELLETALTHPLSRVLAHGADKYGTRNWRVHDIYARTYVAAIRRHLDAFADGEDLDPDSGEPHLAHVAACCSVVLDAAAHGTLTDDRDFAEAKPAGHSANAAGGHKEWPSEMVQSDGDLAEHPAGTCCGLAVRDSDPGKAWVAHGCLSTPCILSASGCPGLSNRSDI